MGAVTRATHVEQILRSFREHSGYYVSETIAEICRCGAAALGASLVRQAPSLVDDVQIASRGLERLNDAVQLFAGVCSTHLGANPRFSMGNDGK